MTNRRKFPWQSKATGKPFEPGFDRRRHVLTAEERSRGGKTTWKRYMRRWRKELNLPDPTGLGGQEVQP